MEISLQVKMKVRVGMGMGMVFLCQMATALVVILLMAVAQMVMMEMAPGLVKAMGLGDLMVWPHAQVMVKYMRMVMDLHPAEAPLLN
jgi:hypothetical protein